LLQSIGLPPRLQDDAAELGDRDQVVGTVLQFSVADAG
jgi:hypothetical protein